MSPTPEYALKTLSIREMRSALSHIEEIVAAEGEVVVTRRGRPLARILPARPRRRHPLKSRVARYDAEAKGAERSVDSPGAGTALSGPICIDTSALAKRYLPESGSDEFDRFLGRMPSVSISRLTVVELRCLLARRRRNHEIDAGAETPRHGRL